MNYIDQHMHSYFSFDSQAQFEDYLKLSDNQIVTTEHIDLEDPTTGFIDRPLNLKKYLRTIDELNVQYKNRLLKGLEVGWSRRTHERLIDILKSHDFDLLILSIHTNGIYDYMNRKAKLERDPAILVPQYLDNLYEGVLAMHEHINVLAHFDYGFRVVDVSVDELLRYGEEKLRNLFDLLIEKDVSFEINMGSILAHNNLELYKTAIDLYLQQGGNLITLGSDAHFVKDYQRGFVEACQYLDSLNVKFLTYYIKQQAQQVSIKELL